ESMRLRFHCQTSGSTLTAAQPLNNIVRGSLQALAAVAGGAPSLHVSGMDEALAIPSEQAVKGALRAQQTPVAGAGIANTIDALGGSYAVEALTDRIERQAVEYLDRIEELGGTVACIESGWFQQEIADAAYRYQLAKESGDVRVVGVNAYRDAEAEPLPFEIHRVDPAAEERKTAELQEFKRRRDRSLVDERLAELSEEAAGDANLMQATIEAVRARATGGEIVEAVRAVYGSYVEHAV